MFVYIQSLLIMMLEILCCKIFFEAFGIKREENNCWKNYSIVIGLTVLCYFIAMIFRYYFIVKQVFSIILIAFFMLLYLKLSFGKALILSALFESLLFVMDYFALLMNIFIFHNMEEVWESHVIQGSLVVVLGKALLLFAVLIIRNHMEKKSLAMLADTEWLRFIFFPIFTICVITAMIKMSEDIKNKAQENLFFVIACGLAGMNIVVFFVVFCKISTLSAIDLVKKLCIVILTVEGGVDMIEKMAMGLVDQMAEEKMIDKEAEEYYVYTLVSLMEKFITIGTILLISVLIEKLVLTAFFLLFFLSLRKRTGGYHMNTFFQCYLGTVVTYMLVLGLCMVLVDYPQLVFGLLLVAICIVEVIGTVNHPNIHMDAVELSESKRAARILCAVEVCVIYTFTLLGADMMYVCHMAVAVILCAVLLLIAKILKQEVKRNEEN